MTRQTHQAFRDLLLVLWALLLPGAAPGWTQGANNDAAGSESTSIVRELRALPGKTLVFVFDVSASMNTKVSSSDTRSNLDRAREATINLIREGAGPGDRLALLTFGAGYQKVFDESVATEADKDKLVELVPSQTAQGRGTNIRKAHHEALKLLDAALPRPGAVVLLTDSFNDEPSQSDPAYADYLRYYTPGGRLEKHPNTPQNRDYERLLNKMQRSNVKIRGIGVQIDQSGRPVERLPQTGGTPSEPVDLPFTPAVVQPVSDGPGIPWLWIALGLGVLGLALLFLLPLTRSFALRISGGPAGAKDFQVKGNALVKLGGEGANFAHDAYSLPGVAVPLALVKSVRGQLLLTPVQQQTSGGPSDAAGTKVFHNGLPLEKAVDLGYGDEVRVSVPDPSGAGVAKEFRLKFEDPKKSF